MYELVDQNDVLLTIRDIYQCPQLIDKIHNMHSCIVIWIMFNKNNFNPTPTYNNSKNLINSWN